MATKISSRGEVTIIFLPMLIGMSFIASLISASLYSARNKANDAYIMSNLSSAMSQSYFYSEEKIEKERSTLDEDFSGFCTTSEKEKGFAGIKDSIYSKGGVVKCNDSVAAWAASATLLKGGSYCVDSTGASGYGIINGTACEIDLAKVKEENSKRNSDADIYTVLSGAYGNAAAYSDDKNIRDEKGNFVDSYSGFCLASKDGGKSIVNDIENRGGKAKCNDSRDGWAISATARSGKIFCTDSSAWGVFEINTELKDGQTSCPQN